MLHKAKFVWCSFIVGCLSLLCLQNSVQAQLVIRESLDLGSSSSTLELAPFTHNSGPGGIEDAGFIVEEGGKLQIYIENGAKYLSKISEDAFLQVQINGKVDTVFQVPINHFFKRPLKTPTNDICRGDWYLYGRGSHSFKTGYLANYIEDSFTSSRIRNDSYDYRNENYGGEDIFSFRNIPNSFQEKGYIKFRIPTIPIDSVDLSRGLNRLSLDIQDFELKDENFFNVNLVNRGWNENNITFNNEPTVKDTLATKLFGSDRSILVSHEWGYYFIDTENFIKYWLSGNSNNGLRFSFPESDRAELVSFWSNEQGRFGSPTFEMTFEYPGGEPSLETIFPLMDVAEGDTVIVSYIDDGTKRERGRTFTKREGLLNGNRLSLYRMDFWESRSSSNLCGRSGYTTERIEAFTLIEHEEKNLDLLLEFPGSKEVWPSIPGTGANNNFDFTSVENVITDIIIEVKEGDLPKEAQDVTITAEWVKRSGGHNHDGGNDILILPDDRMGWIISTTENDSSHTELRVATNSEGEINLNFRAPEFGGEIAIEAWTLQAPGDTLFATDTITVKVPDLVLLPDGDNYEKVGGTASHHGPRLDNQHEDYREPDNNHYATEAFRDSLISIADAWAELVTNDSTLDNEQTPLNINDLSLPNGGKMDVFGSWNAPHATHRVGRDADIRTTRNLPIGGNRNGIFLSRRIIAGEEQFINTDFENICTEKGASPTPGVHFRVRNGQRIGEHYHVYFY